MIQIDYSIPFLWFPSLYNTFLNYFCSAAETSMHMRVQYASYHHLIFSFCLGCRGSIQQNFGLFTCCNARSSCTIFFYCRFFVSTARSGGFHSNLHGCAWHPLGVSLWPYCGGAINYSSIGGAITAFMVQLLLLYVGFIATPVAT